MRVAVIGAGIFGCTIATRLSRFCKVSLHEMSEDIMSSASRTNQLRLHRGYHYPRSPETVTNLLGSIGFFVKEYEKAVIGDYDHYYCIARENSKVSPKEYLSFCDKFNLEYETIDKFELVDLEEIALTVKVKESLLDYSSAYNICKRNLRDSSVNVIFKSRFQRRDCKEYDYVINCTYASINEIVEEEGRQDYQFEVCEKIVVEMPPEMKNKSIVVMDGPFMCVDPYGRTEKYLLGNVVHAIHSSNVGKKPNVDEEILSMLNVGIVKNPRITNFSKFIESGQKYIPSLSSARHIGSMYTVRAVLPYMDDTDGRPTVVSKKENNVINVFSGKIDTCVSASEEIESMLLGKINESLF